MSPGQRVQLLPLHNAAQAYSGFQSPCRRVNGCNWARSLRDQCQAAFQSPCRRVNGCNRMRYTPANFAVSCLSVPLSSGQWVQPAEPDSADRRDKYFQSPCRRVNGCNGVNRCRHGPGLHLSVPLSSGQWVQPGYIGPPGACYPGTFSPLVVGSMGATAKIAQTDLHYLGLSVPLSSGQWVQRIRQAFQLISIFGFQSPCRRVNGCNPRIMRSHFQ